MLVKNENLRKFYEISCNNLKLIYFIFSQKKIQNLYQHYLVNE